MGPPTPARDEAPAAAGGPIDPARLRRAWGLILAEGDGLQQGMGLMMRAARISCEGRTVRLEFPAGHPAYEKISHPTAKRALEDALARRLGGGPVALAVATGAAAAAITADSARRDRLERMMEGEPVLRAAVQAWDLELVD
ncbi:MAG TPA: hypothetical protein VHG91_02700 [Longimicrobium sp.]|nr:hypothetical protein [Longimicrobium sp.]